MYIIPQIYFTYSCSTVHIRGLLIRIFKQLPSNSNAISSIYSDWTRFLWKNWYIFQLYYSHTLITSTSALTIWHLTIMGRIYILHKHGLWRAIRWRHANVLWRSRLLLLGFLLFWLWFLWTISAKLYLQTDDTIVVLPAKWDQGIDNDKCKHHIDRLAHQVNVMVL